MSDPTGPLQSALGDRYHIIRELGRGGMATVYLAEDRKHHRNVAVKVLRPELSAVVGGERFLREIEIAAGLTHPHILPLYDSGEADGLLYYAMPFVEGESLRDRLDRERQLSVDEAIRITREVADALGSAHSRGIVHRDIKPENILLEEGHAVVSDFGIARAIGAAGGEKLTQTGVSIGTPVYMSPEQASGDENLDGRTDLYSLGCVAYEMLVGEPPFTGPSTQAILARKLSEPTPRIRTVREAVPEAVETAVLKALEKVPADRHATMNEFAEAVSAPSPDIRSSVSGPSWRRALVAASMAIAAVAAGVVLFQTGVIGRRDAYTVLDPQRSYVVPPFEIVSDDPAMEWLGEGAAHMLSIGLEAWREIRVVGRRELNGFARKRGISFESPLDLADGIALARDARVGTLVFGEVVAHAGQVEVVVRLFDVASRTPVGEPRRVAGSSVDDIRPLIDQVAVGILDLSGAPPGFMPDLTASSTGSLTAYRNYLEGMGHLYRWETGPAFQRFRAAIESDSTFAQAYYRLSMAMVWGEGRPDEFQSAAAFRGAVVEAAENAARYSDGLPWREKQHILAYNAFYHEMMAGEQDFTLARSMYQELAAADSTDAEAWFGLADVEFHDSRGAVQHPDGRWGPSRNWNVALTGFQRAVELDPSFVLGYGHIIDLYQQVNRSDQFQSVRIPRGPGDDIRSQQRAYYWVAWDDSARVVLIDNPANVLEVIGREYNPEAVDVLAARAAEAAQAWAAVAPDDRKPHHEMYFAYAYFRRFRKALDALTATLEVKGDTSLEDHALLSGVLMAVGTLDTALTHAQHVLDAIEAGADARELMGDRAIPKLSPALVGAVFTAAGQPSRGMRVMELGLPDSGGIPSFGRRPTFFPSRRGLGQIPFGGTGQFLDRVIALGSVGSIGPTLQQALDSLRMTLDSEYSEAEARELAHQFRLAVTPALLILGREAMTTWQAWLDSVPDTWRIYSRWQTDSAPHAVALLQEAAASLDRSSRWPGNFPREYYVLGGLAHALRQDSLAVKLFALGDTAFSGVRSPDPWGFSGDWAQRSLSHLFRAEAYEELGKASQAVEHYSRFLDLWRHAEPSLQAYSARARQGLDRLRSDR